MSFSQELMDKSMDIWQKYLKHPFINEMANNTLDHEKFRQYLIQDTLYLVDYCKVYSHAFIKTDNVALMRDLYVSMNMINSGEGLMHIEYLKGFGMSEDDALALDKKTANKNYLNYMLRTAALGTVEDAILAAAACCLSYYFIGCYCLETAKKNGTYEDNFFKNWIDEYSGDFYKDIYEDCMKQIDEITADKTEKDKERYLEIFRECSQHELNFWDMGYENAQI